MKESPKCKRSDCDKNLLVSFKLFFSVRWCWKDETIETMTGLTRMRLLSMSWEKKSWRQDGRRCQRDFSQSRSHHKTMKPTPRSPSDDLRGRTRKSLPFLCSTRFSRNSSRTRHSFWEKHGEESLVSHELLLHSRSLRHGKVHGEAQLPSAWTAVDFLNQANDTSSLFLLPLQERHPASKLLFSTRLCTLHDISCCCRLLLCFLVFFHFVLERKTGKAVKRS